MTNPIMVTKLESTKPVPGNGRYAINTRVAGARVMLAVSKARALIANARLKERATIKLYSPASATRTRPATERRYGYFAFAKELKGTTRCS